MKMSILGVSPLLWLSRVASELVTVTITEKGCSATSLTTSPATGLPSSDPYSALNATHFKLAAVREPPVNFALPVGINKTWVDLNLSATIAQALVTIKEAKADGVAFISFPELYFPGYPVAINTAYTPANMAQYVGQSFSVDSASFKTLANAFKEAGMYGSFGFSELDGDVIYMGQALIGPDGSLLKQRRKLRPSGSERAIWSDGDISGLLVTPTPHGRIGMLECWEHFHPTMTFPMLAQAENIHVAAFPYGYDLGLDPLPWESTDVSIAPVRSYAVTSNAAVLMPSVGAAAIFAAGGATLNVTNATANLDWKYITATINTMTFNASITYDADGEQSWSALQYLFQEFPAYIPKINGTFFDKVTNLIEVITKPSN